MHCLHALYPRLKLTAADISAHSMLARMPVSAADGSITFKYLTPAVSKHRPGYLALFAAVLAKHPELQEKGPFRRYVQQCANSATIFCVLSFAHELPHITHIFFVAVQQAALGCGSYAHSMTEIYHGTPSLLTQATAGKPPCTASLGRAGCMRRPRCAWHVSHLATRLPLPEHLLSQFQAR